MAIEHIARLEEQLIEQQQDAKQKVKPMIIGMASSLQKERLVHMRDDSPIRLRVKR